MKVAVYCGTRNLYADMVTAAKSLANNSSVDLIYFLIEDPEFPYPLPHYVRCIDVSKQRYFSRSSPNIYRLWTWMVLMRAALPKIFSQYDKILSLDVDTIVDQNIDELWDLDLNTYFYAGVKEPGKSKLNAPYVNMGVAMFNLKKLRDDRMDDRIIAMLNREKFQFPEQDCMNKLCSYAILPISSIYNANNWVEPCENPKIFHFAAEKNWNTKAIVQKYKNMSWPDNRRQLMRYMIHSTPSRQWYVDDYLIPSMLEQGIAKDEIVVYCDRKKRGNLFACMDSFRYCGENPANGTWHIQDDVIISRRFAELTKQYNEGVVCGVVIKDWGPDYTRTGVQPVNALWYSFQCIRIPDELAGECATWFYTDASKRTSSKYKTRVQRNKHDDDFFQFFLLEKHADMKIRNMEPNLVDHVDYLIGGSVINGTRKRAINRVAYWEDEDLVQKLEEALKNH